MEQTKPYIKELCNENSTVEYYEELFFDPFIISFSKMLSEDMWKMKGRNHRGIAIEFHKDVIHKFSLRDRNPYVFMECGYDKDIKQWLKRSYEENYPCPTVNDYQDDLMLISACYINPAYKKQNEYRFLEPYRRIEHCCYDPFSEDNCKCSIDDIDYKEHFISFPKEALAGVIIGHKNSDDVVGHMQRALKYKGYDLSNINIRIENK